jgi:predicted ATPase
MTLAEPAIVGREAEFAELQLSLERAINGKGNIVFISGEAGAGKTRLLTEFLKNAQKKEITVLTGWCLSDSPVPYFPFAEALDSYFSTNEEEEASDVNLKMSLKSWLMEASQSRANGKLADMQTQVWRDHTFGAVAKELLFRSTKRPLILALEDIHWADSASLSLLHYLARQVSSERILILATFRSEELISDLEGHYSPLSKVLLLMGRDSLYKELKLKSLSAADVGGIARSMLRGKVNPQLVERLASDSKGNPLFVVESLRYLFQQGGLFKKNGQWNLYVEHFEIPPKVKDVILRRLGILALDRRKILDVASIIGEKFDPELVAGVVSLDPTDVLIALNEITKSTLLVYCQGDCYRFSHAKSREMLYNEIAPLLRKKYHLRVAEKIEQSNQNAPETALSDLAYHYVQAQIKDKAIKYSLQAGKIALARFSNEEAIKHFSFVVNETEDTLRFIDARASALEGLGDAFYVNSAYKKAAQTFERLANYAQADAVKLLALRKAIQSEFQLGDTPRLSELLKKAEPYMSANRLENARILESKARVLTDQNLFARSLECEAEALQVFEEEYALWDIASSLMSIGIQQAWIKPIEALSHSLRSVTLFEELGDLSRQMVARHLAGHAFLTCLLDHEAQEMFAKIIDIEERNKIGNYMMLVYAYMGISIVFKNTGNYEKALAYGLKAFEVSKKTDSLIAKGLVYSNLTEQYSRIGDLERAEEFFKLLTKLPPEILSNRFVALLPAKAAYLTAKNQWEKSNKYFMKWFEASKFTFTSQTRLRSLYAWSLQKQGRFEEARVQLDEGERIRQQKTGMFEHVNILAHLTSKARVDVGQAFEARLDIANASRACGVIVRIEDSLNSKLCVTSVSQNCTLINDTIELKEESLNPFQVITVKLNLRAREQGEIDLQPKVIYIDDLGKTGSCIANIVHITAQPASSTEDERVAGLPQIEFKFKSGDAQKAFDFLIKAFLEDYVSKKLPLEKSGWRTLMELVKNGKVSRYSAYGSRGYGRKAVSELERRSLVEARVFSGERGRGGRILKLRIQYEKEGLKSRLVVRK